MNIQIKRLKTVSKVTFCVNFVNSGFNRVYNNYPNVIIFSWKEILKWIS